MRGFALVIAMLLLAPPRGAAAEPTLTEAQAITAAKAWVRAVRAGNAAALAKLSAVPMFVAVQMDGCKLDTTVQRGQLAKHAACLKKSIGTVAWRDERWRGAMRDGAWTVEQTPGDDSPHHIALAVAGGRVVRVQAQ